MKVKDKFTKERIPLVIELSKVYDDGTIDLFLTLPKDPIENDI